MRPEVPIEEDDKGYEHPDFNGVGVGESSGLQEGAEDAEGEGFTRRQAVSEVSPCR